MTDRDEYEGFLFSNVTATTQAATTEDAKYLFPAAGPSFFARLYEMYPRMKFNSTFWQRATWWGDAIINCESILIKPPLSSSPKEWYALTTIIF